MPRRRRPPRPGSLADLAPLRILIQIILLQAAYYSTALILLIFTALAAGKHFTVEFLLNWSYLRGDITEGWMLGLVWMLNSLITVIFLLLLVVRSKLVPDFAFTIHFLHLIITSFYTRAIPTYILWWALQTASTCLMTFLGIWSCQWRELRPIFFGKTDTDLGSNLQRTRLQSNGDREEATQNEYELAWTSLRRDQNFKEGEIG